MRAWRAGLGAEARALIVRRAEAQCALLDCLEQYETSHSHWCWLPCPLLILSLLLVSLVALPRWTTVGAEDLGEESGKLQGIETRTHTGEAASLLAVRYCCPPHAITRYRLSQPNTE